MGHFLNGQACVNGHAITGDSSSHFAAKFCGTCGAATITHCPKCNSPIRGKYHVDGFFGGSSWTPEAHCASCGAPFPWTQAKLDAVSELAEAIDELTDFERSELAELMPHLVQETPRTKVAGFKVATILARMKGPGKAAIRDLITGVAVEAGKSALGF